MLTRVFFVLCIVVLRQNVFGTLLGCYHCPDLRVYNYIMTLETVPNDLVNECSYQMSRRSCSIDVQIDFDKKKTTVNITSSTNYIETSINAVATIEFGLKYKKQISFWCSDPHGGCNDVAYLKRVFRSTTIDGSFKELEPLLLPTNQTIDRNSCMLFSNTTATECPIECHEDSKACFISGITHTENSFEVCARCSPMNEYYLTHSKTFFINNLSIRQPDNRRLLCSLPECNSIANLERIRKLVTIDFDPTKFLDPSTTTIVAPTATTPTASGSTFRDNKSGRYCNLFVFLMMSLVYNVMLS
jgi:hypothetical protein